MMDYDRFERILNIVGLIVAGTSLILASAPRLLDAGESRWYDVGAACCGLLCLTYGMWLLYRDRKIQLSKQDPPP